MPAPNNPNYEPAAEARRLIGDATRVRRLRERGYLVFSPEVVKLLPAATVERLRQLSEGREG